MKVGVKFCGNCNPQVDMPELFKRSIAQGLEVTFVRWDNDKEYDVLLVLSSCPVDCATRPSFAGPVIVATSEAVDRWPTTEDELPTAIRAALARCGKWP
jgi:hypothetical protein